MEKSVEWLAGKPKYSEETCPSAALSTTNPTFYKYANPGRRGGKPASNRWATARPTAVVFTRKCFIGGSTTRMTLRYQPISLELRTQV
jgi:hypothetical protein